MAKPNIPALFQELARFDDGPLAYSQADTKALRQRIYHALYYDDQGWHKIDFVDHVRLARGLARINSLADY